LLMFCLAIIQLLENYLLPGQEVWIKYHFKETNLIPNLFFPMDTNLTKKDCDESY